MIKFHLGGLCMKIIKNGLILDSKEKRFYKASILIEKEIIREIGDTDFNITDAEIIDAEGKYIIPSFIDIHTHGALGIDFLNAGVNDIEKVLGYYKKKGTKRICATTVTSSKEKILSAIKNIKEAKKLNTWTKIEGIHIEGPFISTKQPGCHLISEIRNPEIRDLDEICEAAEDTKLRITVAPELPGAEEFIKEAVKRNINIGIGHSNADGETVKKAISCGANVMIHLYNAMSPLHHRKPGCVGIGLNSDVYTELIVDGHHIASEVVDLTYKIKGSDKLVLITDSMQAAGMPDGQYEIGGVSVKMKDGIVKTEEGVLAGSTLNLPDAVKNLMRFTNCSFEEAIICATLNPAKVVNIDGYTGSIETGKNADIIMVNKDLGGIIC